MSTQTQITFKEVDHSDALENRIQKEVARLERFYPRITSCHVTVQRPNHRHVRGNLYSVHVTLTMPGNRHVEMGSGSGKNHAHENPYVAVRDSFRAVGRMLQDEARRDRDRARTPAGETAASA